MTTSTRGASQAAAGPLTHLECMAVGQALQRQGCRDHRPWVQVRRYDRNGPYVLCGQVQELGDNGAELFKVRTDVDGPVWVTGRNVRMCSGDGRCLCEADAHDRSSTGRGSEISMGKSGSTVQIPIGRINRHTGSTVPVSEGASC